MLKAGSYRYIVRTKSRSLNSQRVNNFNRNHVKNRISRNIYCDTPQEERKREKKQKQKKILNKFNKSARKVVGHPKGYARNFKIIR